MERFGNRLRRSLSTSAVASDFPAKWRRERDNTEAHDQFSGETAESDQHTARKKTRCMKDPRVPSLAVRMLFSIGDLQALFN